VIASGGVQVFVQPSARRVFSDSEFTRAGAVLTTSLEDANIILGVKEIPVELIAPGAAYLFFSHVIKGQAVNMPMLQRLMDLGCTLIDYEKIADDSGRRLVFFGRFAGLAGMIDSLWALGRRLWDEQIRTPFADLAPSHEYESLEAAKAAIRSAGEKIASNGLPDGLSPLVVGIAGYGNVAKGAREILAELPTREVAPDELERLHDHASVNCIYQTTFAEEDIVTPRDPDLRFELQHYYANPEKYRSDFARFLPHLTVLMNCNYWDERYPRLVTVEDLHALYGGDGPRLRVIGDLGCDVEGAIECTVTCTEPSDPTYLYDVTTGEIERSFTGNGPVILAVDILPSELPLESSEEFAKSLAPILPALARADFGVDLDRLPVPAEIARAIIVHQGKLTPDYTYLEDYLSDRELVR
jgi:alpha-aminoadipic semialdehyde synthase